MADPIISPKARADLHAIYDYIAASNVDAADGLAIRCDETFEDLAQMPYLARLRPEIGPDVRSFAVRPYIVLYRPAAGGVDIARVIHGARDVGRVFRGGRQ